MPNHIHTRVTQSTLKATGRTQTSNESVEDTKITNDHAFYKLICEKQAHKDFSTEQFNLLYNEISENMIKKPFTIKEINDFCKKKGIPLFEVDELLTLVPRESTKNYVEYETNSVKDQDHGYIAGEIGIQASFTKADSVDHNSYQNYIVDSDAYYKFIYKKVVEGSTRNWVFENLNTSRATEAQMREYLNNSNTSDKELKQWLENNPQASLKEWLNDPSNRGYTNIEYNLLYEKISEELVHTSFSVDDITRIYNQYNIAPPTNNELNGLIKIQEEKRSSENYEEKTGLSFQGRINIKIDEKESDSRSSDNEFNLNIDLFQKKGFEDGNDNNGDSIINNEGLLKALEDTVKTFNKVFGIKKDNNPLKIDGNVANFRLFLFENKESYQEYLSKKYVGEIPGGGAAESSDNNYISNMYSHAENARSDFNHDGKVDHNDYNYVIKHELVHALTFYLTSKLDLGKVLMEGLAEYVTHLTEGEKVADFAKLVGDKYKEHTLEEIIKGNIDPYNTGAAVIAYIEHTYPNFIDNLLYAATEDRKTLDGRFYFKQMMQNIYASEAEKIQNGEGFQHWVQANSGAGNNAIEPEQAQHDEGQHTSHNPAEQKVQQKSDKTEEKFDTEDDTPESFSYGAPGVIAQAASDIASDIWSGVSNWWSGEPEEKSEAKVVTESKTQPSSGSSSLRGLAGMSREDEMHSDQPTPPAGLRESAAHKQEQEQIVLKDTILKVQKSYDRDSEGKHKANISIDYNDIKSLYDRAEGSDKQSVLEFWYKLRDSDYKIGELPEDKYYFKDGKFVIHDSDAKKLIVLPEGKISMKVMKLGDSYDLVITNENGKAISSISRIDNLNYELLSDSSHFNLETEDNIGLSSQHNEYNLYLENGFVKMFDCASDHIYHDHNLI